MNATIRTTDDTTRLTIKTPGGVQERGPAATRHFVREAERIDGLSVLAACDVGRVTLTVRKLEAFDPLGEVAERHGLELTVHGSYDSGAAEVVAQPEVGA